MTAPVMKPSEALRKARDLIEPADKWGRTFCAVDFEGRMVDATSIDAVCFCSEGALRRVLALKEDTILGQAGVGGQSLRYLEKVTNADFIWQWNDDPDVDHAEVLAAFDKAAALAEEAGQ